MGSGPDSQAHLLCDFATFTLRAFVFQSQQIFSKIQKKKRKKKRIRIYQRQTQTVIYNSLNANTRAGATVFGDSASPDKQRQRALWSTDSTHRSANVLMWPKTHAKNMFFFHSGNPEGE